MAGTNEFLAFATGSGNNAMGQGEYTATAARLVGNVDGIADPRLNNKPLRQGTSMAAALGKVIADTGGHALDNGDIDALAEALKSVMGAVQLATTTTAGISRLATQTEANEGTILNAVLTPGVLPAAIALYLNGEGFTPNHNDLKGIQGGDATHRMHLTQAEYDAFINGTGGGGVPAGVIAMWSGSLTNIPSGWGLCDGVDGRPNMLGKFVRGIVNASTNPGSTGGSETATLTVSHLPSHTHGTVAHAHTASHSHSAGSHAHTIGSHAHTIGSHTHSLSSTTATSAGDHRHVFNYGTAGAAQWHPFSITSPGGTQVATSTTSGVYAPATGGAWGSVNQTGAAGAHTHTISGTTVSVAPSCSSVAPSCGSASISIDSWSGSTSSASPNTTATGNGAAFSIIPPYYEVAFVVKL